MNEWRLKRGVEGCLDGQQQWLLTVIDVGETHSFVQFFDARRPPERIENSRIAARPTYQKPPVAYG